MPNIDNLKKQAKALVRLHEERSYHLSCVARETLPKFEGLSDREILAGEFKLADAQEILARQHGCESWTELKARFEGGEDPPEALKAPAEVAAVSFAVPVLYVVDVRRAVAYYADRLGFEVQQVSGQPPFYAEVRRGGATLALRLVYKPAIDPEVRRRETTLIQAAIRVADIKGTYLEFLTSGATFNTPLQREPWGPQGFIVEDPDGNLIAFGEPGPKATPAS